MVIEELLDNILYTPYHNAQSEIRSVVYNVEGQEMLDRLRSNVIVDTVDAHKANLLDTNAGTEKVSKKSLTSSSFLAPIA